MTRSTFLFLSWLSLGMGCASLSNPKPESALDAPLDSKVRAELESYCRKGNPFACYRLGADADEQKNWGEAKSWFNEACELRLASACSEASVMSKSHLNQLSEAYRFAKKSCDLNDTLGCYNQACYECLTGQGATAALKSLKLAIQLGYRNLEALTQDPDLQCFRSSSHWESFVKQFPAAVKDGKILALGTGPRHLYHPRLRFSYAAVPGFSIQYSPSGVLVHDDAGSRIFFTGSHQGFSEVKAAVEKTEMLESSGKAEVLAQVEGSVNGKKSFTKVVRGLVQGLEVVASIYVTGDEKYTVTSQATYLSSFHSTYGDAILHSAESVVIDPRGPPSADDLAFERMDRIGKYRFAGLRAGAPLWNTSGKLPSATSIQPGQELQDTLILNSFIFTPEDPWSEVTLQKLRQMVAAQSGLELQKNQSGLKDGLSKMTSKRGNQALIYQSQAKVKGQKIEEIRFELGLVKMPLKSALGQVGYFWARGTQHEPKPQTDSKHLKALISLELKPDMIEEFKNAKPEDPEISTPKTTGDGNIPAS
jgi:hypothetical protein